MTHLKATYLAIDLETTGLSPDTCRILEAAALPLDDRLEQVGTLCENSVVECSVHALDDMDEHVRKMHTTSGLLSEVNTWHSERLEMVVSNLLYVIDGYTWTAGKPILLGSSVNFDRAFLKRWMPEVEMMLHHRHLDATTLMLLGHKAPTRSGTKHRAMDDIRHSIACAKVGLCKL